MNIKRNRLQDVTFEKSNSTSGKFRNEALPDTLIIHYTAGRDANGAVRTLTDSDTNVSAHIVVDYDGSLIQLLPFNMVGWHCGRSKWLDRKGINQYSIGIEIVNAGHLEKNGNTWRSWFGKPYTENEVIHAVHRNQTEPTYWHQYTEEQIESVYELSKSLVRKYDLRFILGHEEISPGRKIDPGPAFPLDKLREKIFGSDWDRKKDETTDPSEAEIGEKAIVTASALNFRAGPGKSYSKISEPLPKEREVTIIGQEQSWYQLRVSISGWAAAKFVEKENEKGMITASALNIRSGPGIDHKKISDPLSRGTEVTILEENSRWLKVMTDVHGWSAKKFIEVV